MIKIHLDGGLGKQLFQIFNGISYAIENNKKFCFTMSDNNKYWFNMFHALNKYKYKKDDIIDENFVINYDKFNLYKIDYLICFRYFEKNYGDILEIFQYRELQNKFNNYYKDTESYCSIHFRIGDYVNNNDYIIMGNEYYLNAVIYMMKRNVKKFLIFYENINDEVFINNTIEFIKERIDNIQEILFINNFIMDYEQLILMSCCKNNIIANSSFSWWGAYLNKNPEKIVIRPKFCFSYKYKNKVDDFFPDNWITI